MRVPFREWVYSYTNLPLFRYIGGYITKWEGWASTRIPVTFTGSGSSEFSNWDAQKHYCPHGGGHAGSSAFTVPEIRPYNVVMYNYVYTYIMVVVLVNTSAL